MAPRRQNVEVWEAVEASGETSHSKIIDRKTERGRKTWTIQSLVFPRIHVKMSVWEQDREVGACAVPMVSLDDVEILLPTPFMAFGAASAICEWISETAISGAIERADSYMQAAIGMPAAIVKGGHTGDVRQLDFMEREGFIGWPFVATTVIDENATVTTTFVLWAEENGFSLRAHTHLLNLDGTLMKVIYDGEITRTSTPSRVHAALVSSIPSILARYPLPGTVKRVETPFQRLLREPRAFGENVVAVDFRRRAGNGH